MRPLLFALLCCCTLPAAHASDTATRPAPLRDYLGQYVLQDGRVLSVTERRHRLVAQLDGHAPVVLAPRGAARFGADTDPMCIDFDQHANGNVAGVTLIAQTPAPRQAQR